MLYSFFGLTFTSVKWLILVAVSVITTSASLVLICRVMVSVDCQLGKIWKSPRDKHLDMPVGDYLSYINWTAQICPLWVATFPNWDPGLHKWGKPAFIPLDLLTVLAVIWYDSLLQASAALTSQWRWTACLTCELKQSLSPLNCVSNSPLSQKRDRQGSPADARFVLIVVLDMSSILWLLSPCVCLFSKSRKHIPHLAFLILAFWAF